MTAATDSLDPAQSHWRHALALLAASTLLRLAFAASVPLVADEAYYWEWSRRLAFGYFDHPPVIAWLIAGGTALFGDSLLGVRILPVLCGTVAGVAVAATVRHVAGGTAARFAALLVAVLPLSAIGFVLATPDAPLLAAIALTLHCVVRAVDPQASRRVATVHWAGAGIAIGIAMASKLTGVFVPIAVALATLMHPALRQHLRTPGPWLAVAVASLAMLPVLLWNANHEWISFRFQLGHGLGSTSRGSWWQRELDLIGGQAGLLTPILFVLVVGAIHRAFSRKADPQRFVLATVAVFCLLFFVYSATRKSVEANWPAIAWLPALALLAAGSTGARSAWERRGTWLATALTAIALLHVATPILPIPARRDPVSRAYGWDQLAAAVDSRRASFVHSGSGAPPPGSADDPGSEHASATAKVHVSAARYQDAALLAFHLPDKPDVFALTLLGRLNQYDIWPRFPAVAEPGDAMLLALNDTALAPALVETLRPHFATAEPGPLTLITRRDDPIAARRLWILGGWRGSWPTDPNAPLIAP